MLLSLWLTCTALMLTHAVLNLSTTGPVSPVTCVRFQRDAHGRGCSSFGMVLVLRTC